jgi:hypothetical protein
MFENTRWSNPNYQPNYDYGQRVQAAREGMWGANAAIEGLNLLGKGVEAYAQRKRVDDILKRMDNSYPNQQTGANYYFGVDSGEPVQNDLIIAGGGGSVTEAGNPLLSALTQKEYDEIVKKYLQQTIGMNEYPLMNFDYGVV